MTSFASSPLKILLLSTAFNSLSQRVALELTSKGHCVTVELALHEDAIIEAAELAGPDLIICPFLTKRVPSQVYQRWLTLIVHPGPPGDAGPSAIDYFLFGDHGELDDANEQIALINSRHSSNQVHHALTRSHWGVTVLQAIEALDSGPVWAFDQFQMDQELSLMTKSELYRGPITRAAINGVFAAVDRVISACSTLKAPISPALPAPENAHSECVSAGSPFQGGVTRERPLLKAATRDLIPLPRSRPDLDHNVSAAIIVQRINSADSQPGLLTSIFGCGPIFVYGASVQEGPLPDHLSELFRSAPPGTILATRQEAILVAMGADLPVWITHVRRPKAAADKYLTAKLPAVQGLRASPKHRHLLMADHLMEWHQKSDYSNPWKKVEGTFQQVWVDLEVLEGKQVAFVGFQFYNGASSTSQCQLLSSALDWALSQPDLAAIVLLGGSGYFSNGIALNTIECAEDPAAESWANINAIDEVVSRILAPANVLTIAALRGNAAAGGLALATACDVVLCSSSIVLNPAYRGVGLFGSEYHTWSYHTRCGHQVAERLLRGILPMSPSQALQVGLVDYILGEGSEGPSTLLQLVKSAVGRLLAASLSDVAADTSGLLRCGARWTKPLESESILADANSLESSSLVRHLLMNKQAFLLYRFAHLAQQAPNLDASPRRSLSLNLDFEAAFDRFRQRELEQMRLDFWHPVRSQRYHSRRMAFVRKLAPAQTPARFALHRRYGTDWAMAMSRSLPVLKYDDEEVDDDGPGDVADGMPTVQLPLVLQSRRHSHMTATSAAQAGPLMRRGGDVFTSTSSVTSTAPTSPRSERMYSSTSTASSMTTNFSTSPSDSKRRGDDQTSGPPGQAVSLDFESSCRPNATLLAPRIESAPPVNEPPQISPMPASDDNTIRAVHIIPRAGLSAVGQGGRKTRISFAGASVPLSPAKRNAPLPPIPVEKDSSQLQSLDTSADTQSLSCLDDPNGSTAHVSKEARSSGLLATLSRRLRGSRGSKGDVRANLQPAPHCQASLHRVDSLPSDAVAAKRAKSLNSNTKAFHRRSLSVSALLSPPLSASRRLAGRSSQHSESTSADGSQQQHQASTEPVGSPLWSCYFEDDGSACAQEPSLRP